MAALAMKCSFSRTVLFSLMATLALPLAAQDDVLRLPGDADEAVALAVELAALRPQRHAVLEDDLDVRVRDEERTDDFAQKLVL